MPSNLTSNLATSSVAGAIAVLVLKYLDLHGVTMDESTTAAFMTVAIAASHAAVEVFKYAVSFLPKPKVEAPANA